MKPQYRENHWDLFVIKRIGIININSESRNASALYVRIREKHEWRTHFNPSNCLTVSISYRDHFFKKIVIFDCHLACRAYWQRLFKNVWNRYIMLCLIINYNETRQSLLIWYLLFRDKFFWDLNFFPVYHCVPSILSTIKRFVYKCLIVISCILYKTVHYKKVTAI